MPLAGRLRVLLFELVKSDLGFSNAVKMLIIKGQNDGAAKLPMKDLINSLNKMGFSASGRANSIRQLVAVFKTKNNNLIADVNNDMITLTTVPSADTPDQAEQNKADVSATATAAAMKEIGL